MPEHYFTEEPTAASRPAEIAAEILGQSLRFTTDSGVFSRSGLDAGTRLLVETVGPIKGRGLDLGCGWGPVGVAMAKAVPESEWVMTDVNARAVELAKKNLRQNGAGNAEVVQGDGFEAVDGCFDAILLNPPIRAGKALIYHLFEEARQRLNPGGKLYIVIRKQQGAPSALTFLRTLYDAEVIKKGGGYWVIRCQRQEEKA